MNPLLNLTTKAKTVLQSPRASTSATVEDSNSSQPKHDFETVLRKVRSGDEAHEEESPKVTVDKNKKDDSSNDSANGLAAGKEQTLAGEEGSSRSASLSPSEPDSVEETNVLEQTQQELSEVLAQMLQNPGGESPFHLEVTPESLISQVAAPDTKINNAPVVPTTNTQADLTEALPVDLNLTVSQPVATPELKTGPVESATVNVLNTDAAQEELPVAIQDLMKPVEATKLASDGIKAPEVAKPEAPRAEVSSELPQAPVIDLEELHTKEEPLTEIDAQPKVSSDIKPQETVSTNKDKNIDRHTAEELFDSHVSGNGVSSNKPSASSEFTELIRNTFEKASAQEELPEIGAAKVKVESSNPFAQLSDDQAGIVRTNNTEKAQSAEALNRPHVLPGSVEDQILRQIKVKLAPGVSHVDIQLFPPELGSLRIRFDLEGDRMKARIEAQQGMTGALLERHLPELKSAMQDAGIEVNKFEIFSGQQADGFFFSHPNQSEEKRHEAFQSGNSKNSDAEFSLEEVGAGVPEYGISRADGGIDYFV